MGMHPGKTVLVTGASGALGTAVCRAFDDGGAFVAGAARHAEALPHCQLSISADLTTPEGAHAAVTAAHQANGRLDAVIHILGAFAGGQPLHETAHETWTQMIHLNATTAFLVFHEALPLLLQQPRSRILAAGSRAPLTTPAGLSAYSASKAALHSLIQTIAAENVATGLTANAVLPSTIDTPANRAAMPGADPGLWVQPSAIASLLVYLASDAAQDTNGALIPIYGRS